jgi:hypothetical protein
MITLTNLNHEEAAACYEKAATELGIEDVPDKYIDLAGLCAREVVLAICNKNRVELVAECSE